MEKKAEGDGPPDQPHDLILLDPDAAERTADVHAKTWLLILLTFSATVTSALRAAARQ